MVFRQNEEGLQVLLIKRKHGPYEGKWAFPGGFVDMEETVEEAVGRELKEETGLTDIQLRQFYTFSAIDRDPRGRTVSVVFYGFDKNKNQEVKGDDDAASARWHYLNQLPELAFDHQKIIHKALDELTI